MHQYQAENNGRGSLDALGCLRVTKCPLQSILFSLVVSKWFYYSNGTLQLEDTASFSSSHVLTKESY